MTTPPPGEVTTPRRRPIPTRAFSHQPGLALGAQQTLRVLRPLQRRGAVLGLVDDAITPCGSEVDLVLTTYGPVATHSAWHEHGLLAGDVRELASESRDQARLARELLVSVEVDVPVMPVVVVWGPDETAVPCGGRVRHDVMFLRGSDLAAWLTRTLGHSDAFTQADVSDLLVRLRAYRTALRAR